jgi:hypothetical protein
MGSYHRGSSGARVGNPEPGSSSDIAEMRALRLSVVVIGWIDFSDYFIDPLATAGTAAMGANAKKATCLNGA